MPLIPVHLHLATLAETGDQPPPHSNCLRVPDSGQQNLARTGVGT